MSSSSAVKKAFHACRASKDGFIGIELLEAVLLLVGCPRDDVKQLVVNRLRANARLVTDGRVHIDEFIDWIMVPLVAASATSNFIEPQTKLMQVAILRDGGGEKNCLAVFESAIPSEIAACVAKHLCYEKCWLGCLKSLIPTGESEDRIFFAYSGLICDVRGGLNWIDDIEFEFVKSTNTCFITKHIHRCW